MSKRSDLENIGCLFALFFGFKWLIDLIDDMSPEGRKIFFICVAILIAVLFVTLGIVKLIYQ